jgi:hypothetical protein
MFTLTSPFKNNAEPEDESLLTSDEALDEEIEESDQESQSSGGGLSEWKRIEQEAIDSPQDNGGGLSEWKTKRKRNGLKGRTPKHPMNKRPYTC